MWLSNREGSILLEPPSYLRRLAHQGFDHSWSRVGTCLQLGDSTAVNMWLTTPVTTINCRMTRSVDLTICN